MDADNTQLEKVKFEWIEGKEATPELYTNYIHTSWTLYDVSLLLGQLVPAGKELNEGFRVEKRGVVTMAWPQAKALRDTLTAVVASYEKENGEINPIKLPPVPTPSKPSIT